MAPKQLTGDLRGASGEQARLMMLFTPARHRYDNILRLRLCVEFA